MNRSGSPYTPRSIAGHGSSMTRRPGSSGPSSLPSSSTTLTEIPGSGRCEDPGFVDSTPGMGAIMWAPVSVCHHVSTTGQRSPPMTRRYQVQASGLMGSPTLPSRRSEDRSYRAGMSSPHFMHVRIAVGAV